MRHWHCATLLALLILGPHPLGGQQVSPDRRLLAEQFQIHYFIHDSIASALPGYVGFDSDFPCNIAVHMLDTLAWADSARDLFQHALPPDTSVLAQEYCAGHPKVHVRAARYSLAQLMTFASRIGRVLGEPSLRVRGSVRVTPETLIVGAHNQAALERARIRLAREVDIPQDMLAYRVWKPELVDGPVSPPRAAYLAVLDTIAAAPSEPRRPFVIDPARYLRRWEWTIFTVEVCIRLARQISVTRSPWSLLSSPVIRSMPRHARGPAPWRQVRHRLRERGIRARRATASQPDRKSVV